MYKLLVRPLLFKFDPERVHHFTFAFLAIATKILVVRWILRKSYQLKHPNLEREVFGIKFPNPVGLAAGLDKNALLLNAWYSMGFGFIEIGTVTPVAQSGNPKPRLFRFKQDSALVNRMGFNNDGADVIGDRLKKRSQTIIVGGNIGKNKGTANENAQSDYLACYKKLYAHVDYFVVNVSSPNTPGLRELQEKEPLSQLLHALQRLNLSQIKAKPILLKIAPDLTDTQLDDIVAIIKDTKIAGVIATNTTVARKNLKTSAARIEYTGAGGLSGMPLRSRSTEVIRYLKHASQGSFPIIGVGGIHSVEDALEKLEAGASLVQLYTGFIYEGPGLVKKINNRLKQNR